MDQIMAAVGAQGVPGWTSEWGGYLLLFGVGYLSGALNVLAGGGSFLTLPVLIFLGLPPTVANGTNRVGIWLQNVGASWGFHRHGILDLRSLLWAALPATVGAAIGTALALVISDEGFQRVLAFLMVAVSLWTLWSRGPSSEDGESSPATRPHLAILGGGFFLVGIYGGFVQAGVGFFVLAATSAAGLDLVRGNAVKVLSILCLTTLSLAIFWWQDKVVWSLGWILAAGNLLGAHLGVRLTILKGHGWLQKLVTVMVVLFALQLWLTA